MTGSLAARWLLIAAFAVAALGQHCRSAARGQGCRGPGGSFLPGEATRAKDAVLKDHPAGRLAGPRQPHLTNPRTHG